MLGKFNNSLFLIILFYFLFIYSPEAHAVRAPIVDKVDIIFVHTGLLVEDIDNSKITSEDITNHLVEVLKKETRDFTKLPITSSQGKPLRDLSEKYAEISVQVVLSKKEAVVNSGKYLGALQILGNYDLCGEKKATDDCMYKHQSFLVPFTFEKLDQSALPEIESAFLEAFRRRYLEDWKCDLAGKCMGLYKIK